MPSMSEAVIKGKEKTVTADLAELARQIIVEKDFEPLKHLSAFDAAVGTGGSGTHQNALLVAKLEFARFLDCAIAPWIGRGFAGTPMKYESGGQSLPDLEEVPRMIDEVDKKTPGLKNLLKTKGIGNNAIVANMLIDQARRWEIRNKR